MSELLQPSGVYCDIESLLQLRFVARNLQLFSRKPSTSMLAGGLRTRFRGRGIDFEEVRTYQPGDDIRNIDWRVTARTQIPHTKLFTEERERPVLIVSDQRAPMFFGSQRCFKSVAAAHLCTLIGWTALAHGDRVGAMIFGQRQQQDIRPRRSKHSVLELIHQLCDFNQVLKSPVPQPDDLTLLQIFEEARRVAKPGSAVFIASDFHDWSEACEEQLYLLQRHCDVTLFHIYDALEVDLPASGRFTITDGEQRHSLLANSKTLHENYRKHYAQRLAMLTKSCQKMGISLLSFATTDDLNAGMRELYGKNNRKPVRTRGRS
jgi:uncharacterized protein (DUF58 family)